jgi:arginase
MYGKNKHMYQTILSPIYLGEPKPALEALAEQGWQLNRPAIPEGDALSRISAVQQGICEQATLALEAGKVPVCIGGDCMSVIGMTAALQKQQLSPVLLFLDAHGDLNTPETSPSGYWGGMPLAMVLGYGPQDCIEALHIRPYEIADVLLCDARDLDPGEKDLIAATGLRHIRNIDELASLDLRGRPLYIHFDTDIIDPHDAPAQLFATAGGPRAARLSEVLAHIGSTQRVCAVTMTPWEPALDQDGRSRQVCMSALQALLQ